MTISQAEKLREFPELWHVIAKLSSGEKLDKRDKEWVKEVSEGFSSDMSS